MTFESSPTPTSAPGLEVGDLATWSGAGVSLLTLFVAVVAALFAFRANRFGQNADKRADADRKERLDQARRDQAEKVCAWYDLRNGKTSLGTPVGKNGVVVANRSNLPIYQVTVKVHLERTTGFPHREVYKILVPPGEHFYEFEREEPHVDAEQGKFGVSLEFSDASDARWARTMFGKLIKGDPSAQLPESAEYERSSAGT